MTANPIKIILWLGHRRLTSLATECSPDLPLSRSWKISAQYAASWIYTSCATHADAYDVMMSLLSWSPDCLHSKLPVICHDSWVPLWSGFCVSSPFACTWQLGSYHSELSTDSWKEACFLTCSQVSIVLRHPSPLPRIPILYIPAGWLMWTFTIQILSETIPTFPPTPNILSPWVIILSPFTPCTLYGIALYYRDWYTLVQLCCGLLACRGCVVPLVPLFVSIEFAYGRLLVLDEFLYRVYLFPDPEM